MYELQFFHIVL